MISSKEIVWIFGPTAAGKSSFMKRLLIDRALQKQKGIEVYNPITPYGLGKNWQRIEDRTKKVEELVRILDSAKEDSYCILIEGQKRDLKDGFLPFLVRIRFIEYSHRVLFLWTNPKENSIRAQERKGGRSEEKCRKELLSLIRKMEDLQKIGFSVFAVESANSYAVLSFEMLKEKAKNF